MAIVIIVLLVIGFLVREEKKGKESLAALNAECDAGNEFIEWRIRNQGVYIGLSEEGRMLLGCWLEAYDWFLRTHSFIDGAEHRAWLVKMFYDFPPKYPDNLPSTNKKGVRKDARSS